MEPGCCSMCCAGQPAARMLPALANSIRAAILRPMGWAQASFCGLRKSVIFYPVIPIRIVTSVRSKSLSPLLCLNGAAGCPVPGSASPYAAPGSRCHQKKPSPAGDGFFLYDEDHQILVMSTRSTSLMVVSMSRHSVRAMAVSTAVRQAMDRSTALRRICTECSAGLRPVALVEIR